MRITELKRELELLLEKKKCHITGLEGVDNPQVVSIREKLKAEVDLLKAIIGRIEGDRVTLSLM